MGRKEEIMMATLDLAAENGLQSVTLSQIADKVGIRKASLYNHFQSKDDILENMYEYIRAEALAAANPGNLDYGAMVQTQAPEDLIRQIVDNYRRMNREPKLFKLYKVVYSERTFQPEAARIMKEEAERMLLATKSLFYAMQVHGKLRFDDVDLAALSFTMAIHDLMEYDMDCRTATGEAENADALIERYITGFCKHYEASEVAR